MPWSALELPQMWQRPSFDELLACLKSLERKPLTWKAGRRETVDDDGPAEEEYARVNERAELARYLSSIIKSPLEWIYDDEQKDAIWTEASRRISERSGRGAMGDMIRTWPFEPQSKDPFELTIKEPALTGHLLGFKTWGSSYRLALELERLAATSLSGALPGHLPDASRPRVLELGSGTGLLGLAAAAIWETHVALTDLPDILPNLAANAERNRDVLASRGGSVDVGTLAWGDSQDAEADEELFGVPHQFKIILAADTLYDDDHPSLLSATISRHLSRETDARAVVMVAIRDGTAVRLLDEFKQLMLQGVNHSLVCFTEEELEGYDDWGGDGHQVVKCWLGVFKRTGNLSSHIEQWI